MYMYIEVPGLVCVCVWLCTYEYGIIYYNTHAVDELTISSSLHRLSSSSDIRFSCFLKYLRLAACRLNHVYENALTLGNNASMNGWNSSCGQGKNKVKSIRQRLCYYTLLLNYYIIVVVDVIVTIHTYGCYL